ncbi:Spherulin-1A [Nymphaea thermarum]|nr:Spherulin-1A [Nymphaea thermarum]
MGTLFLSFELFSALPAAMLLILASSKTSVLLIVKAQSFYHVIFMFLIVILKNNQAIFSDMLVVFLWHSCSITSLSAAVVVNGKVCKNPMMAKPEDFFFSGLDKPGNTSNPLGSMVTAVNVQQIPGLNTLGISLARVDFAPWGVNPPHTHPRGTEILVVLEGSLYVGFVTSNPENRLFTKKLYKGDVFVFPQGLIHFQQNIGEEDAVAIAALSSQNPGVITIANAVFGAKPPISDDLLAKAFQVDKKVIDELQFVKLFRYCISGITLLIFNSFAFMLASILSAAVVVNGKV